MRFGHLPVALEFLLVGLRSAAGGAIELGGFWIGPLAERLDLFTDPARKMDWSGAANLKFKPSGYIARHVRVTPFVFEPVAPSFAQTVLICAARAHLSTKSDQSAMFGGKLYLRRIWNRAPPPRQYSRNGDLDDLCS